MLRRRLAWHKGGVCSLTSSLYCQRGQSTCTKIVQLPHHCLLRSTSLILQNATTHPAASSSTTMPLGLAPHHLWSIHTAPVWTGWDQVPKCKELRGLLISSALHESHSYFWQIQGQLLITGLQWFCDLCPGWYDGAANICWPEGNSSHQRPVLF